MKIALTSLPATDGVLSVKERVGTAAVGREGGNGEFRVNYFRIIIYNLEHNHSKKKCIE